MMEFGIPIALTSPFQKFLPRLTMNTVITTPGIGAKVIYTQMLFVAKDVTGKYIPMKKKAESYAITAITK